MPGSADGVVYTHLSLSRTGVALGTAAYMSPEQVRGEKLDARTDLFSFGLVLYEMATGQQAFTGHTAAMLHDAILNGTSDPSEEVESGTPTQARRDYQQSAGKGPRAALSKRGANARGLGGPADEETSPGRVHAPVGSGGCRTLSLFVLAIGAVLLACRIVRHRPPPARRGFLS